jgi:hypothetical protein
MHHHLQCYSLGRMLVAYSEGAGNELEKTSTFPHLSAYIYSDALQETQTEAPFLSLEGLMLVNNEEMMEMMT